MKLESNEQIVTYKISLTEEELYGILKLIGPLNDEERVEKGMSAEAAHALDRFYLNNFYLVRHLSKTGGTAA